MALENLHKSLSLSETVMRAPHLLDLWGLGQCMGKVGVFHTAPSRGGAFDSTPCLMAPPLAI